MKNKVLSIAQMRHLRDLGVETNNASMVIIYTDSDGCVMDWDEVQEEYTHPEPMEIFRDLYDADSSYYDHSYREDCGVFTLQDILEILPEYIPINDEQSYDNEAELFINRKSCRYVYADCEGHNLYTANEGHYNNVLESAYNLLCWCAENGYLNNQKPI